MPRSMKSTTRLRVVAGLAFAFVFPGFVLGEAYHQLDTPLVRQQSAMDFPLAGIAFGVILGWPYVVGAACVWGILDSVGRHYAWSAALVGVLTGLSVAAVAFHDGLFQTYPIAYPLCGAVGLVTGLGVWWIAYGRQSLLPEPRRAPSSRPLSL